MNVEFKQRLGMARRERGLDPSELDAMAGLRPGAVSTYERGATGPSIESIRKLCGALHVSSDYLLGLSDYIYPTDMRAENQRPPRGAPKLSIVRSVKVVSA